MDDLVHDLHLYLGEESPSFLASVYVEAPATGQGPAPRARRDDRYRFEALLPERASALITGDALGGTLLPTETPSQLALRPTVVEEEAPPPRKRGALGLGLGLGLGGSRALRTSSPNILPSTRPAVNQQQQPRLTGSVQKALPADATLAKARPAGVPEGGAVRVAGAGSAPRAPPEGPGWPGRCARSRRHRHPCGQNRRYCRCRTGCKATLAARSRVPPCLPRQATARRHHRRPAGRAPAPGWAPAPPPANGSASSCSPLPPRAPAGAQGSRAGKRARGG